MEQTWTSGDAKLLRELRQAAGIDRAALARRCALSMSQLAELEEGGSKQFYSERIKSHTGRAVLARLGYSPAPATAPALAADPAPTLSPTPTWLGQSDRMGAPGVSAQRAEPQAAQNLPQPLAAASAPPPARTTPATTAVTTALTDDPASPVPAGPSPESVPVPAPAPVPANGGRFWVGVLVVGVAVVGFLTWLNRPKSPDVPSTAMAAGQTVQMAPAAASVETREPVPAAGAASVPAPVSAPAVMATATTEARCPEPGGVLVKYTPVQPFRPGNYVYLEASRPVQVCVTDARQQPIAVQVRPGTGETVPGTPPFIVQSAGWGDLRVFFQGVRVPLEGMGSLDMLELQTP